MTDATQNTPQAQQAEANGPIYTHWDGPLFAKIWENESDKGGVYHNVTLGKLYTHKPTGETRETGNLQKPDLPRVQYLLGESYRTINQMQQAQKRGQVMGQPTQQSWPKPPQTTVPQEPVAPSSAQTQQSTQSPEH